MILKSDLTSGPLEVARRSNSKTLKTTDRHVALASEELPSNLDVDARGDTIPEVEVHNSGFWGIVPLGWLDS